MELNLAVVLNKDLFDVKMQRVCAQPSLENPDSVSQSSPSRDMEIRSFGIQIFLQSSDQAQAKTKLVCVDICSPGNEF